MAHYARVNELGVVVDLLVIDEDMVYSDDPGIRELLGPKEEWIQTSYNTFGGKHYKPNTPTMQEEVDDGVALRYNFGRIGYHYDKDNDAFYEPQPYASWTLDETFLWQPPVAAPDSGRGYRYNWIESDQEWVLDTLNGPYESWEFDEETNEWVAPKTKPVDGKKYRWNEEDGEWVLSKNQDTNRGKGK